MCYRSNHGTLLVLPHTWRTYAPLVCERVYAAAGRGLCLTSEDGLTGPQFKVRLFDVRI